MPRTKTDDEYSPQETKQRFEAALRGARSVGHKSMKEISPKKPAPKRKPSKRIKASA